MEILFEDESLIVCIKPQKLLSQGEGSNSLVSLLKDLTDGEIYPIHRLDKGVGGVMVYAKTKAAAASLCAQVAERKLQKEYFALVHGAPEKPSGVLEDLLFKDSAKNRVYVVKRERKGVKKAVCEYETLYGDPNAEKPFSLLRVRLKTGRTHQIRVQFASRKCPLFGDRKYGAKDDEKTIALFSCALGFLHPKTGEKMKFSFEKSESSLLNFAVDKYKHGAL